MSAVESMLAGKSLILICGDQDYEVRPDYGLLLVINLGSGQRYHCSPMLGLCTCPAAWFSKDSRRTCKHVEALRAHGVEAPAWYPAPKEQS